MQEETEKAGIIRLSAETGQEARTDEKTTNSVNIDARTINITTNEVSTSHPLFRSDTTTTTTTDLNTHCSGLKVYLRGKVTGFSEQGVFRLNRKLMTIFESRTCSAVLTCVRDLSAANFWQLCRITKLAPPLVRRSLDRLTDVPFLEILSASERKQVEILARFAHEATHRDAARWYRIQRPMLPVVLDHLRQVETIDVSLETRLRLDHERRKFDRAKARLEEQQRAFKKCKETGQTRMVIDGKDGEDA